MIVSQTPTIHNQIEALLEMLGQTKASTNNQSLVTIDAIWLTIDEAQLGELDPKSDRSVDREALEKLTKEFGRRGQITCFDGQRVHIASGNLRSSVESVVPVVGQNDGPGGLLDKDLEAIVETDSPSKLPNHVMAQVTSSSQRDLGGSIGADVPNSVGYQPVARWTNYGTVLQVLPRVETDRQIWLDISSIIVKPGGASTKTQMGQIEIDSHNMHCQQFKTTLRVSASTPILVGGSAFDTDSQDKMQTYLILEASEIVKPAVDNK